ISDHSLHVRRRDRPTDSLHRNARLTAAACHRHSDTTCPLALRAASLDSLLQSAGDLPDHLRSSVTSYVHILQHFEATTGVIVHDVVKDNNLKLAMNPSLPDACNSRFCGRALQTPAVFLRQSDRILSKRSHRILPLAARLALIPHRAKFSARPRLSQDGPHPYCLHPPWETVLSPGRRGKLGIPQELR